MKIEESQISLTSDIKKIGRHATDIQRLAIARRADKLTTDISAFISEGSAYLAADPSDETSSDSSDEEYYAEDENIMDDVGAQRPDRAKLPLPSTLGEAKCKLLGLHGLQEQELRLRAGQANDTLHEIRLALANKAVLFRTDVRHASSHATSSRAWGKVNAVEAAVSRYAAVYRRCRKAMVALGADETILNRYQLLKDKDLKVTAAASAPNARGRRNEILAWFWSIDVPRDTETSNWMSECRWSTWSRVHG